MDTRADSSFLGSNLANGLVEFVHMYVFGLLFNLCLRAHITRSLVSLRLCLV